MWDLIVSVPDHLLSFYFSMIARGKIINKNMCLHIIRNKITKARQPALHSPN